MLLTATEQQMFDNVGGEILDLALGRMKKHARIARKSTFARMSTEAWPRISTDFISWPVCGAISLVLLRSPLTPRAPS